MFHYCFLKCSLHSSLNVHMEARELLPGSEAGFRVRTASMEITLIFIMLIFILFFLDICTWQKKTMQIDMHPLVSIWGFSLILHNPLLAFCTSYVLFRWSPCV